jgi:hypothetical protein
MKRADKTCKAEYRDQISEQNPAREETSYQIEKNRPNALDDSLQRLTSLLEQMRPYETALKKKGKDLENVHLRLAYPKKGLPTSLKEVDKLINDTEDILLFLAPETRNNEIEYISRAALELYGFTHHFPDGSTARSSVARVAHSYMPEDANIYATRQEFIKQQHMLGRLADGGLYQLPDSLQIIDKGGQYLAVESHAAPLFSIKGKFLGALISLQCSVINEEEYNELIATRQLLSPKPQEVLEMVKERHIALLHHQAGKAK